MSNHMHVIKRILYHRLKNYCILINSCAGNIGMYLLVKKCVLLLLHGDNGCFMNAPYLDTHGEVDLGLK